MYGLARNPGGEFLGVGVAQIHGDAIQDNAGQNAKMSEYLVEEVRLRRVSTQSQGSHNTARPCGYGKSERIKNLVAKGVAIRRRGRNITLGDHILLIE